MLRLISVRAFGTSIPKFSSPTAISKLRQWTSRFRSENISEPLNSASLIIAFVLGRKTFAQLNVRDKKRSLDVLECKQIDELCNKRLTALPVQYVLEEWDFCGLTLKMRPPVLIPRPETEDLVQLVIDDINCRVPGSAGHDKIKSKDPSEDSAYQLLEVGSGSGAITLALISAFERGEVKRNLFCTAIDKDESAFRLTVDNAVHLKVDLQRVTMLHADICTFKNCGMFDGIVSNPPYIPSCDLASLQPEVARYESEMALHGGEDGLDVVRQIVETAANLLKPKGLVSTENLWIWLEVDVTHPDLLQSKTIDGFAVTEVRQDFYGRDRFVKLER